MKKAIIFVVLVAGIFGVGQLLERPTAVVQNQKATEIKTLSLSEFKAAFDSQKYILLDIRTEDEYKQGHIPGAKQIDYYQTEEFSKYLDGMDEKAKYLIYCRSGKRSASALEIMKEKGFENVSDLSGGYTAWNDANMQNEKN